MPDNPGTTWPDSDVANLLYSGDVWSKVLGGSKTSYRRVWDLLWEQAAKKRGLMKVTMAAGDALVPPLSVHDALALISVWKHAAGRGKASFPWYEYTRRAFGQVKLTEKYVTDAVDPKHARRPLHAVAGPAVLASLWFDTRTLADALDASGTVQRELTIDQSSSMRDRMARDAWNEQKRLAAEGIPIPGGPVVPTPVPPVDPTKPPITGPATGNWTWLLLVVGALLLTSDGRR